MPIFIQYMEDNGVVFKGEGIVTFEDFYGANALIYSSKKKIKEISYQMVDLDSIDKIELSNDELEQVAHQDKDAFGVNPDMRIAIIGPADITFGLARVWDAYACQMDSAQACEIFRNR